METRGFRTRAGGGAREDGAWARRKRGVRGGDGRSGRRTEGTDGDDMAGGGGRDGWIGGESERLHEWGASWSLEREEGEPGKGPGTCRACARCHRRALFDPVDPGPRAAVAVPVLHNDPKDSFLFLPSIFYSIICHYQKYTNSEFVTYVFMIRDPEI